MVSSLLISRLLWRQNVLVPWRCVTFVHKNVVVCLSTSRPQNLSIWGGINLQLICNDIVLSLSKKTYWKSVKHVVEGGDYCQRQMFFSHIDLCLNVTFLLTFCTCFPRARTAHWFDIDSDSVYQPTTTTHSTQTSLCWFNLKIHVLKNLATSGTFYEDLLQS